MTYDDGEHWDATATIAPEQVARRIHRLRLALDDLAGRPGVEFDDLDRRSLDAAHAAAARFVDLVVDGVQNPRSIAAGIVDGWDVWTADERDVAVYVVAAVLAWLYREGPR